jgi:channel protein (hemolysin III family)
VAPIFDGVRAIPGLSQPISSWTHLAAAAVAAIAAIPLIRLSKGKSHRTLAVAIYAFCVVATLAISGTYHSLDPGGGARAVMKRADYFAIWLLIAGTFTAVHGIMCKGFWRRGVLTGIWSYAAIGIFLQIMWFRVFSGLPGRLLYLGLGWFGIASVVKIGRQIGFRTVVPILYAGAFYSVGAVLEATDHPTLLQNWIGPHEIFHVAVVAGVAIHWWFIRSLLTKHAPEDTLPVGVPGAGAVAVAVEVSRPAGIAVA